MKKFCLIILLLSGMLFAEALNIVNDDPAAEIFVDGQYVGAQAAYGLKLSPGTHHVKVSLDGLTTYSKIVVIESGKTKTLNTSRFVEAKTNIANKGAKLVEAKRIREARGNLAFGGYGGNITSGISMKWFLFENIGIQAMGWWTTFNDENRRSLHIRPMIVLANSIAFDHPMNLYGAIGYGVRNWSRTNFTERAEIYEILIGMEIHASIIGMPLAFMSSMVQRAIQRSEANYQDNEEGDRESAKLFFGVMGAGGLFVSLLDNAYVHFDLGVQRIIRNQIIDYEGVKFSAGLHFYF